MKKTTTERGFELIEFTDSYGAKCSIQQSSRYVPHVWIGVNDADPRIMASKANEHGVNTPETTGWVPYPIPSDVLLNTRMHLNKGQLRELIDSLESFYSCMPDMEDE